MVLANRAALGKRCSTDNNGPTGFRGLSLHQGPSRDMMLGPGRLSIANGRRPSRGLPPSIMRLGGTWGVVMVAAIG